jgi:secondary thiamine-phosphate synthase enzyme
VSDFRVLSAGTVTAETLFSAAMRRKPAKRYRKMAWLQRDIQIPPLPKGCHSISRQVIEALPELENVRVGQLQIFIQHTSASLTINENADPDVLVDLDAVLDSLAPEDFPYRHTCEGRDDMPSHVKSSVLGSSLLLPISNGRLRLGTWQGICLFEHRRRGTPRRLVLTLQGEWD